MKNFRQLKDTSNTAKSRLRKISNIEKYFGMEKSNPDKTNFKRLPYYLTEGKKSTWKKQIMSRFERVE